MPRILEFIDQLRSRPSLVIREGEGSFAIMISKGSEFACDVTVPRNVLEWFASVVSTTAGREVWKDWMDYEGYDDRPTDELETDMLHDIEAFIDRVAEHPLREVSVRGVFRNKSRIEYCSEGIWKPLAIWEEEKQR